MSSRFLIFSWRERPWPLIDLFQEFAQASPLKTPWTVPPWLASRFLIYHVRDLIFLYAGLSSAAEPLPELAGSVYLR